MNQPSPPIQPHTYPRKSPLHYAMNTISSAAADIPDPPFFFMFLHLGFVTEVKVYYLHIITQTENIRYAMITIPSELIPNHGFCDCNNEKLNIYPGLSHNTNALLF